MKFMDINKLLKEYGFAPTSSGGGHGSQKIHRWTFIVPDRKKECFPSPPV